MALGFRLAGRVGAVAAANLYGIGHTFTLRVIGAVFGLAADMQGRIGNGATTAILSLIAGFGTVLKVRAAGLLAAAGGFTADQNVRAAAVFLVIVHALTNCAMQIGHRHTPHFILGVRR